MTTTFLLDLDNTLLGNDMNVFLPAYFDHLARRLSRFTNGRELRQITIRAVQVMLANQDPTVTNFEAFTVEFTRLIGYPVEAIQPALDAFYREDYPQLQTYTTTWPRARQVVQYLFDRGYKVVIATNPLFVATAIEQRLEWAGISDFPYNLVTTMENSHFAKPNPRYYQEILSKIESTPEVAWMVGDDLQNDIVPARALGLKTWWLTNQVNPVNLESNTQRNRHGTLSDFLVWLET